MKLFFRLLAFSFILLTISEDAFSQSAIYACGHIRRQRETAIDNLRNSGYNTAIIFNVNVEIDGSLTTDYTWSTQTAAEAGGVICYRGEYVFDEFQPHYIDDVKAIITPPTSVERLEICIGGWGNGSYGNINRLVETEGTGENSILYKNFKALKEALPDVVAVNNDTEQDYYVDSAVKFHKMLYELGFKTTIAPYTMRDYWQRLVAGLHEEYPGACDRVYLQTYGGGAMNNPANWMIFGDIPMYVGFDCEANANRTAMNTSMTRWAKTEGVVGGFLWNYNSEARNHNEWAANINRIFSDITVEKPAATFYGDAGFKGYAVELGEGTYRQSDMARHGIAAKDISSFEVKGGYKLTLYKNNDLTGDSETWTASAETLDKEWDNMACSLKIEYTGEEEDENAGTGEIEAAEKIFVTVTPEGVKVTGTVPGETIRLYNIDGQKTMEKESTSGETLLPVTSLPSGLYILTLSDRPLKIFIR